MKQRQKVPLEPSSDLAPAKFISVTPVHRLDMELFNSHDWAADIYPQSHRVMEPVCPSCTVILWPFTSCLNDHCYIRGEQLYHIRHLSVSGLQVLTLRVSIKTREAGHIFYTLSSVS